MKPVVKLDTFTHSELICLSLSFDMAGNDGCGVYVMGGTPLVQLNQIYNNNDPGVAFVSDMVHL